MARCLNIKPVVPPGISGKPMYNVPLHNKPYAFDYVYAPCGKCINCVKNRQNNFACRLRAEAEKRGSMCFITLTYAEECLPLVSTLWCADKDSGEFFRVTEPDFVCYSRKEDFFDYRLDMKKLVASSSPRYFEVKSFEDEQYEYITRITPSVCRKDVQLWIKSFRNYAAKYKLDLDFSYAICSEYGPRTCRPHYHCCFFGLSEDNARILASLWSLGYTDLKFVKRVNEDGSDGFSKVSNYIGKYVSKGVFECDSVKCGAADGCRMMTSVALGSSMVERFASYVKCEDIIGAPYDIDRFWIPSQNRHLTRLELASLCENVPKRLSVSFDGKYYFSFPRVLRNKIFYVKTVSSAGNISYRRPSRLWKMVVDSISRQYVDLCEREFKQFLSSYNKGTIAEAVAAFNEFQEVSFRFANSTGEQNYLQKLSKSKF